MSGRKGGQGGKGGGGAGSGAQRGYPRSHRVGDFIQRELAQLIRTEVKDPRVSPMLTVSAVDVSRDLSVATVHWTTLDGGEKADTQEALQSAGPFLRRRLASLLNIRAVPLLRFRHDDSSARGAYMSALIDDAVDSNTTDADPAETIGPDESADPGRPEGAPGGWPGTDPLAGP